MPDLAFVLVVIFVALVFDFINGFHDSANSIATIVATGVLKPRNAVLLAAFWNFAGAFIFSVAVATTIGKNVIDPSSVTISIILAALLGAIMWNLITWYFGIPSSSSHALIGGLIGAGMAGAGIGAVHFSGLKTILVFIVVAPVLGFIGALLLTIIMMWTLRRVSPARMDWSFKKLQLVSSSAYSLSHGTNDAQKTMGVITLVLLTSGMISEFHVPVWVILSSYTAIALGTFFGGWRIVRTMGLRITKLRPFHGCMAETAGSAVLLSTAHFGIPVSTTHVISGSIMGVGTVRRSSGVRWQIARKIVVAWLLTIPVSALAGALAYAGLSLVV
ncbi:TPA: inorganic phosphate transporter [Candidatus Woesearchaeota archaeon]|nr:inorganic phosphate transporter [Candidatus Woesearchaeota archaeon]